MTVKANRFTPEVLLSTPRRSAGVPNADGTLVLYTSSTYSFQTHSKTTELRCLNVRSQESTLITSDDGISEPVWLAGQEGLFACLKSGDKASTELVVSSCTDWKHAYTAGVVDAPASSLKLLRLSEDEYALVLAAQASPDGSLYNPETAPKTHSTGKLYKSLFVRHWDDYVTAQRNALWYGGIKKENGKYKMSNLSNALKDTGLESPISPFGGTDSFDVCASGIIFVAKDPELNPALNTKCNVYYLNPLDKGSKIISYDLGDFCGASSSPVFSPDGKSAAFLGMRTNGYESDKNHIFLIPDVKKNQVVRLLKGDGKEGAWDRSPQNVFFSPSGEKLYFSAEDEGYGRLFSLVLDPSSKALPERLTDKGYVSDIVPLSKEGLVFTTGSSLIDSSVYTILDPVGRDADSKPRTLWMHSASKSGSSLGLFPYQVSSLHSAASNPTINKTVHAWVMKPSTFTPETKKKYPLALLIHGGPQGSWGDNWSTRWNPAIFAEAGYIVVAPNPTGSTGYGQGFTDAIRGDWGGAPYRDLVNCMDYIEKHMPEVDMDRAVALGASYGGYMINWLNGHDLGRRFKALVCHDGIFSFGGLLATEELYFPFYDLCGTPWGRGSSNGGDASAHQDNPRMNPTWTANDPSLHISKWQTPQLVIHSSKDYRLPVSEGLAAFNVLQARGVRSQFLTFADENHWVLKPENGLAWHKVVLRWINGFVGLGEDDEDDEDDDKGQVELFGGLRNQGGKGPVGMVGMGKPET